MDLGKKCEATAKKQSKADLDKALSQAVQQRNSRNTQSALEAGASPNQTISKSKESLINYAIRNSNIDVARLLIKHKVNLEIADTKKGNTPLLSAVKAEQMKVIKLLLNHSNIDAQNHSGFTPLIYAAQNGSIRLVKELCLKNANVSLTNNKGQTALDVARENNKTEVENFLEIYQNNNLSKKTIKAPVSTPKKSMEKKTKKQTKKEKIGPLKRLLIGFSQGYAKKYPASSSEWSLKKKNQHAQEAYMSGILPDLNDTWFFKTLSHQEVQGDTGTNAFLPPESVEKIAENFVLKNFEAYVYYQPKQKLADKVEAIYKHLGYLPASYKIDVELESETNTEKELKNDHVMTYGHGTTEVFDTILEQHIKNKRDSIIVPTPTYGLFIPLMKNHCKIKTLPTSSENSGAINPVQLKNLIEKTEKENIEYYKEYFSFKFSELNKAELKIKSASNCEAFVKLLNEINKILSESNHLNILKNIEELDVNIERFNQLMYQLKKDDKVSAAFKAHWLLESVPKVRSLYFVNPSMPSGKLGTQSDLDKIAKVLDKHPSINIIEDVTHRGIVLKKDAKIGSFTKTSAVDRTLVLDGISKIFGLARARASILIGHRSLITSIAHSLHLKNCTLNGASHKFLNGIYKLSPQEFKDHLIDLSESYQKRLNLFKAVMFGQGDFSKKEFDKIKKHFSENYEKINKGKKITVPQKEFIFSGMDKVKLYCEPEAGYFVLIDLSEYIGQYLGSVEMRTGMDFRNAFYNLADVNSLADVMCYDEPEKGKAYIRYTLSMDSEIDMVEGLLRMKKVLAQCKPIAMEIPAAKENVKHSSPRKKGERKKTVFEQPSISQDMDESEEMSDVLAKPGRALTLLKDIREQNKKKETVKEKIVNKIQTPVRRMAMGSANKLPK